MSKELELQLFDFERSEFYYYCFDDFVINGTLTNYTNFLNLKSFIDSINRRLVSNNLYVKKLESFTTEELLDTKISIMVNEHNKLEKALITAMQEITDLKNQINNHDI